MRSATSSVGLAGLELARAVGVRLSATTRTDEKGRRMKELGAASVVLPPEHPTGVVKIRARHSRPRRRGRRSS